MNIKCQDIKKTNQGDYALTIIKSGMAQKKG